MPTRDEWPTCRGLIFAELAGLAVGAIASSVLKFQPIVAGAGIVAMSAAIVLAWIAARRIPGFNSSEIGIVVSLSHAGSLTDREKVNGVLTRLTQLLQEEASALRLRTGIQVVVRPQPAHASILNDRDADSALRKANATYVIWASGTAGSVAGRPALSFDKVHFMVRHRTLPPDQQLNFQSALTLIHSLPRQ